MTCWASDQCIGGRAVQATLHGKGCLGLSNATGSGARLVLLPQYATHARPSLAAKIRPPPASSNSFGFHSSSDEDQGKLYDLES